MTHSKNAKVADAPGAGTTKGKEVPATTVAAQVKNAQEELQKKLQTYNLLQQKVNQRSVLQVHKDTLAELQVTKSPNPFDEQKKGLDSIELNTENGSYEIKNPTLLEKVRVFLIGEIAVRTNELEAEILEAQF